MADGLVFPRHAGEAGARRRLYRAGPAQSTSQQYGQVLTGERRGRAWPQTAAGGDLRAGARRVLCRLVLLLLLLLLLPPASAGFRRNLPAAAGCCLLALLYADLFRPAVPAGGPGGLSALSKRADRHGRATGEASGGGASGSVLEPRCLQLRKIARLTAQVPDVGGAGRLHRTGRCRRCRRCRLSRQAGASQGIGHSADRSAEHRPPPAARPLAPPQPPQTPLTALPGRAAPAAISLAWPTRRAGGRSTAAGQRRTPPTPGHGRCRAPEALAVPTLYCRYACCGLAGQQGPSLFASASGVF